MKRCIMIGIAIVVMCRSLSFGEYVSPYDSTFSGLDAGSIGTLTNALESRDYDMVYSAIKRIGQLRLTNTKARIQTWFRESNPGSSVGREWEVAQMRNIFNVTVWTLGRIGDDHDAEVLAFYYYKIGDMEERINIINALGELRNSPVALDALEKMAWETVDQRLAERIVIAIMKHNKRSSYEALLAVANRSNAFGTVFREEVSKCAEKLLSEGR